MYKKNQYEENPLLFKNAEEILTFLTLNGKATIRMLSSEIGFTYHNFVMGIGKILQRKGLIKKVPPKFGRENYYIIPLEKKRYVENLLATYGSKMSLEKELEEMMKGAEDEDL